MKIMHVTEAMGGGVQNAISKYTQILPNADHVVVGRPRHGEESGEFTDHTKVSEFTGSLVQYLLAIRQTILSERPDVVHLHSSLAGLARTLVPRGVPIAYSPHCYAFERRDKNALWRTALRSAEWMLSLRRQTLIAVSPHEADLGRALNPRMSVHYVPNVLTTEQIGYPKARRPTVSMVGRVGAQKDPGLFAAVAATCGGELDFMWIGDGDPYLKQKLVEAGVTVSGWVDPKEARRLVASSHLYLHTGSWEAAPISAMEAAAAGVPVIARRIPTMESLGYFTASESVTELAQVVQQFFTDDVFQHTVSLATSNMAERLTTDEARRALANAYTAALTKASDGQASERVLHEN